MRDPLNEDIPCTEFVRDYRLPFPSPLNFSDLLLYWMLLQTKDGCLQVHLRAVQEEAERCDALPAPHQVLAVSPAHQGDLRMQLSPVIILR